MEGQNVQVFGKGTSSPKSATVSFWVKSSETGGLQVNLVDDSNNAQIHSSVTINQANTWEHKTVTYSMDHSGYEIDNDNARRFWVEWIISRGSDYTGGSMQTSWTIAAAGNTRGAGTTINSAATVGTTFQITGVQLEVGDTATLFEHRSYGEELSLCQRYYEKVGMWGSTNFAYAMPAYRTRTYYLGFPIQYKVTKRAIPSVTFYAHDETTTGVLTQIGSGVDLAIQYGPTGNESGCYRTQHASNPDDPSNGAYGIKMTADAEL
jgi:hypothetical protein